MEDQDAHKLKFTLETSGWTDVPGSPTTTGS